MKKTFALGAPEIAQIQEAQRQSGRIAQLQSLQHTKMDRPVRDRTIVQMIAGSVLLLFGLVMLAMKLPLLGGCALALGGGVLLLGVFAGKRSAAAANAAAEAEARELADLQRQLSAFLGRYGMDASDPEEKLAALLTDRQRYLDLSRRNTEWAEQRRQTEARLEQIQSTLQQAFEKFYPGECYDDGFIKKLREAVERYRHLNWRVAEERERRSRENDQDRQEVRQATDAVQQFLEAFGLSGQTASECLQKAQADVHRRKLLCEELENAKNALDDFLKKNGDVGPAQQNALPEAEVLEQQERLTQARLDELEQELQQAREQRRSLQASVECIPEWEDRLTALEDDLREAERKCDLTDRTMALLEKAKDALANSYMDKIEQGFRSYTQQLFPRQLGSVMVDKDLQPHIDVQGAAREVESFSAGLADSILLCMRLALVDALFGEETPFLILDDPFVNLDDEHTRRALAMLQEMAETHQILYLVCNTGRV